jgi:hypothetical protein
VPRYRLLAVDLDGTLLTAGRDIPEENLSALRAANAAGVAIAIVTGRRFPALRRYVAPLGFDAFVVANSGALVRKGLTGPILRRRLLPIAIAHRVLEIAEQSSMEPVVHDGPDAEGHLILRTTAREVPSMKRYLNQSYPEPRWVSSIEIAREPVQIGFTGTVEEVREFESTLRSDLGELRASFARTEYPEERLALLDVLESSATKSKALEFLAETLGIELSSTMAIGDNWNDLEMLERAGLGVLMGNATSELRSRGLAETTTNDEAGVALAISRYLLG